MPVFEAVTMTQGLGNVVTALEKVTDIITSSEVLMTMFCGGLLVIGAKVFKRIKNASK